MRIKNPFTGEPARRAKISTAVVVCVQRPKPDDAAPQQHDIDALIERVKTLLADRRLGDYDGCDAFSSEWRLYLFSRQADELATAVMDAVTALPWHDRVHVRVSLDPLGTQWRSVDG